MFRKKKLVITLCCLIIFATNILVPQEVLANVRQDLPKLELPTQKQLKIPTLQKDKSKLMDKLKERGYGQKSNNSLKMPEAKVPKGVGKKANDKFKEELGDMWKNKPLEKKNNTPKDNFFKRFINNFTNENDKELKNRRKKDSLNKTELDTSNLYDLNKIKSQNVVPSSTNIPSCRKPKGWDSTNKQSKYAPSNLKPMPKPSKKHLIIPPILFKRKNKNKGNSGGKTQPSPQLSSSKVSGKIPTFIPNRQYAYQKQESPQSSRSWGDKIKSAWGRVKAPVAKMGVAAAAGYAGFKVVKGIGGFIVGGPAGAAVGVLSP